MSPDQTEAGCLDSSWSEVNRILQEDGKRMVRVTLFLCTQITLTLHFLLFYLPLVSSLAFCVAKSASQCRAELLPSPDERGSLAEDWVTLQGEDVPLVELLTLVPTLSPPPLSDGTAVCVGSVLIAGVSPSDFGVVPIPGAAAARTPLLLVADC